MSPFWLESILKWAFALPEVNQLAAQAAPPPEPSPLHDAVAAGDLAAVRSLLAAGHSASTVDANWDVPLQLAAALPSPEVAEALLAAGADPNARNKLWADTPLCTAVHAGRLGCVEALLAAGADTQLCGRKLSAGPQRVAALRLKHGLESDVVVAAAACAAPHSPLFYAAAGGHLSVARALLRAGAKLLPAEREHLPEELRGAALMHKLEVVRTLRAVGAELGDPSSEALYAQAWGGELEAVQCWVVAGAELCEDQRQRGASQLLGGVLAADLPRVQRWLAAGVDPGAVQDAHGRSVRQLAAATPGISEALCEMPLALAAELGHERSLQAMLRLGAAQQLGDAARARLLGLALAAGLRGDWLAALLPEAELLPEQFLCLWVEAAGTFAGQQAQGLPWARAALLALSSWGLPAEVGQRVLAFGTLV